MTVLRSRQIVTPDGVRDGWLRIQDGVIAQIGDGDVIDAECVDLGPSILMPGFIDIHNHGGGGMWVTQARSEEIRLALDVHIARGTTGIMVSLMSAPIEALEAQLAAVAELLTDPWYRRRVLGVHLEGPFLSPQRAGAQPKEHLVDPSPELVERLVDLYPGLVRMVTMAPELAHAAAATDVLRRKGVIVSVGHSAATFDETSASFDRGATVVTHLFNGMAPLESRRPGVLGASLVHSETLCEIVADGVHVHAGNVQLAFAALGIERVVFVTDAAAVAGLPDGDYPVVGRPLSVRDGAAYDTQSGDLVGSIMTMADLFARGVHEYGLSVHEAAACTTGNPSRAVGVQSQRGAIEVGRAADLVVLQEDLRLSAVLIDGALHAGALPSPSHSHTTNSEHP